MLAQLTTYIADRVRLTDTELQRVLSCFHLLKAKKNELVGRTGEPSRRMFFVNKGCLRVYYIKPDGREATRRFAFENSFSTSLTSFIDGSLLKEDTQAVEPSELLYMHREDFYALVDTIPAWGIFYRGFLEYAYLTNTKRLEDVITLNPRERYQLLLKENPEMVLRLPNKLVANYLNITQEALSRIKSGM
ncbi:cAMP-binding domain of CRP or a regulatory subunit of cAMP-dependent protein kinases [Chitinophaga eiseniae]|uniref:cAMP-binding domain of CRP or a regulatory subunit of cAMP-dependent protein kinases n=1 Tax=Chitinophaga eiseniae TaxID=634771 RepID=A0A1T4MKM7_9BACT|nr:Crp/Fnr family transcriptional regulator [Chitinophaga eiseniae]SJZ67396.1 cAMP-binding domain of CRP or a regulatory subunit of cAMP-dependent protein kinases [Chitinophaga eiseniae]